MSNTCEKCNQFDDSTTCNSLLGITCDLCRTCFRAWARRYHKNPDTIRFEVLSARADLLRASTVGKQLDSVAPFMELDVIIEEREAIELKLVEDTIDWLEEIL